MKKIQYNILLLVLCTTFACRNVEKEKSKNDFNQSATKMVTAGSDSQKEKIFEGTFMGIEQGDYAYFKVKNAKEEKSFMVLNVDKTYEQVSADPEKYIGRKVRVHWVATKEDIPEAGGKINVDKYIKSVILK